MSQKSVGQSASPSILILRIRLAPGGRLTFWAMSYFRGMSHNIRATIPDLEHLQIRGNSTYTAALAQMAVESDFAHRLTLERPV